MGRWVVVKETTVVVVAVTVVVGAEESGTGIPSTPLPHVLASLPTTSLIRPSVRPTFPFLPSLLRSSFPPTENSPPPSRVHIPRCFVGSSRVLVQLNHDVRHTEVL